MPKAKKKIFSYKSPLLCVGEALSPSDLTNRRFVLVSSLMAFGRSRRQKRRFVRRWRLFLVTQILDQSCSLKKRVAFFCSQTPKKRGKTFFFGFGRSPCLCLRHNKSLLTNLRFVRRGRLLCNQDL